MEARASMISPSAGMTSPASHSKTSPFFSWELLTDSSFPSVTRLAGVSSLSLAQAVSLSLAPCFGDGFRKVGKKQGQKKNDENAEVIDYSEPCASLTAE